MARRPKHLLDLQSDEPRAANDDNLLVQKLGHRSDEDHPVSCNGFGTRA